MNLGYYLPLIVYQDIDNYSGIRHNGYYIWMKDGKSHRNGDFPAVICIDGRREWRKHGQLHRDNDLPAVTELNGYQAWWQDGYRHRTNDLPAIIGSSGNQEWFKFGQRHRSSRQRSSETYYLPAIIRANGSKAYWIDGIQITYSSRLKFI